MKIKRRKQNLLTKKSRRGFRGYPAATVAFYGPDDKRVTKVVVGSILHEGAEPDPLERWLSDRNDARFDEQIGNQVKEFMKRQKVLSVVTVDRIIGCPHEEGVDYPEGSTCPECPFWEDKDRWTGETNDSKLVN